MSIVTVFAGSFCGAEEVAQETAARLGSRLVRDEDLIGLASRTGGLSAGALRRAMFGRPTIFNQFSHERERAAARLKTEATGLLARENLVLLGFAAQLIPRGISHVLKVCLIAPAKGRAIKAARELGLTEKEALGRIHKDDEAAVRWVEYLKDKEPWDPELYDMRLAMDQLEPARAVEMICQHAGAEILAPTPASLRAAADFGLAARVEEVLAGQGHNPKDLPVSAREGAVRILVNKKVLLLGRLSEELERLARGVEGVGEVRVEAGPGYYQADVYRQADFHLPSKVLLVDDEREFVQTLSERLMLREIGSAVVYDGAEALRVAAEDEPEVIVLDLKMPGLDGVEVLRKLKEDHPETEVIILTGHGSQNDREKCLGLGAFAYLEKPVDINRLSQVMQEAYDKIRQGRC